MTERIATTPFGGGHFSAAIFQRQTWLEEQRKAHQESANQTGRADKWQLLRALTEARMTFHLSDRTIAVLEALLSFHQEKELDGLNDIIVFPSNAELSLRTRGMAPATLRRHLAELVKGGFIIRRDSPNGKRYARKDGAGRISEALPLDELYARCEGLVRLRAEVEKAYLDSLSEEDLCSGDGSYDEPENSSDSNKKQNMSANGVNIEHHIHNSKTEHIFERCLDNKLKTDLGSTKDETEDVEEEGQKRSGISLTKLRMLCPDFADYARDGLKDWPDALAACAVVRPMLGISKDAWERAVRVMGQGAALSVLAYVVQRGSEIHSAGGYLRSLTEKAENGAFSIRPMMDSLVERE